MKLYEIDEIFRQAIAEAMASVDSETGEILDDAAIERLDAVKAERADKLEACAVVVKELGAQRDALGEEIKALLARKKRKEARIVWLKDYIARSMTLAGERKIDTPRAQISLRASSSVVIDDLGAIPEGYVTTMTTQRPNKQAIAQALRAGQSIAGAHFEQSENAIIR